MRPEGAEWLLQQNSSQPDPTEQNAPSQWGSHALILITPTSQFLLVSTVPAPYTIPAASNCMAATLPALSNALALLLPLPQCQGCVADRCLQAHPRSHRCRECQPAQGLPGSVPATAKERQAEQQKTTFPWCQCPQLPTASMQGDKSAYEGGICIRPSANTQDLSKRLSWEKDTQAFSLTKTFPY